MKKQSFYRIALVFITVLILQGCMAHSDEDIEAFRNIYIQLKDEQFDTAKYEAGQLVLKDKNFNEIKTIEACATLKTSLIAIDYNKEEGCMFFITSGAVDDSSGILFTESGVVNMNGLYEVRRRGDAFYFQTFP